MTSARRSPERVEQLFLTHLSTIDRIAAAICARHHVFGPDADDFAAHVRLKVIENDYAILDKFEGRSSLGTYLTVVIDRLFLDYRISLWGKWRPSAGARREGAVGILLEQLLVRDGHTREEAFEILSTKHGMSITHAELERIASRLPARSPRRFESDGVLAQLPSAAASPDALLIERDRQQQTNRVLASLERALSRLATQDRLVLVMRFEDGRTVADIARALRLDQRELYRRIDRLLRDVRAYLDGDGVPADDVRACLGADGFLDWRGLFASENAWPRPSNQEGAQR